MAPEVAEELLRDATAGLEVALSFVAEFDAVMVAHTGPGLAGLAWWWED
jgi:hypothetical protein